MLEIMLSILIVASSAFIALHYYRRQPRVGEPAFWVQYNLANVENIVKAQHGFSSNRMFAGERTLVSGSSSLEFKVKDLIDKVLPSPAEIFEEHLYEKGSAAFSVTAEFEDQKIIRIYLKAKPEATVAAETWRAAFIKEYPNAPIELKILPWAEEGLDPSRRRGRGGFHLGCD